MDWKQEYQQLMNKKIYGSEQEVEDTFYRFIEKLLKQQEKRLRKYWYHAGMWHDAECPFLSHDDGVCNCKGREAYKNG